MRPGPRPRADLDQPGVDGRGGRPARRAGKERAAHEGRPECPCSVKVPAPDSRGSGARQGGLGERQLGLAALGLAQHEQAHDGQRVPVLGHRPRGGEAGLGFRPRLPQRGGEVGADRAAEAADAVPGERPGSAQEGTTVETGGEVAGVLGALPAAAAQLVGAARDVALVSGAK
jgi:hypothetical protein